MTPSTPAPTDAETLADREDTSIGGVTWHSSEEDGGPDVGISVYLGPDDRLWCGEISKRTFEDAGGAANFEDDAGWFVVRYQGAEAKLIAQCGADNADAREFVEEVAAWVRKAYIQSSGGGRTGADRTDQVIRSEASAGREIDPSHATQQQAGAAPGPSDILRNSAPQEMRGDEPVAGKRDDFNRIVDAVTQVSVSLCQMYENEFGWDCKKCNRRWSVQPAHCGASQQSPRLEREGVASEVRKAKVHVVEQWEGAYGYVENAESLKVADAILALLSPDTAVVSSTSRCEVGK